MINLKKKYQTKYGLEVVLYEIVENVVFGRYFSIAHAGRWLPCTWYADTGRSVGGYFDYDLVEVNPYKDFVIDEPVMVSNNGEIWNRRHFAGVDKRGNSLAWAKGNTLWGYSKIQLNRNNRISWKYCRRPTEQELNDAYSRNKTY